MIETIVSGLGDDGIVVAAQLLRDVNVRYDGLAVPPDEFAVRLEELIAWRPPHGPGCAPARRSETW
jgi:hypothetical protein